MSDATVIERRAADRGRVALGWLESRHGFSFGQYHDPRWMGFGPLRVVNEDTVAPGAGFPTHAHANMEILSYVLSGALSHRDDHGGEGVLHAGEVQWMGAGHGIAHSEFNASSTEPVHFLQVWIQPDRVNAPPAHAQRRFDPAARRGRWVALASPDGADGSLAIRQQAWMRGTLLAEGASATFATDPARLYWLQVARGAVDVRIGTSDYTLRAGDALGLSGMQADVRTTGIDAGESDVLAFDLPPA